MSLEGISLVTVRCAWCGVIERKELWATPHGGETTTLCATCLQKHYPDDLAPARGVFNGVVIGAVLLGSAYFGWALAEWLVR